MELDVGQRAVVEHITALAGCALVTGGPGSGKTTALVLGAAALVASGVPLSRVVVLTSSRAAAQRLRRQIVAEIGTTQVGARVTTPHGWCRSLVAQYGDAALATCRLLSAPEQDYRVRELAGGVDWPPDLRPAATTPAFAGQLRFLLARARQLGLDPGDLAAAGRAAGRDDWVGAADFFSSYLDVIDGEQVLDYAELVHRSRLLLTRSDVAAAVSAHTSAVLVDEFAECDESVVALLRDVWRAGVPVTTFGDATTAVFGFRGAWPGALKRFPDEFADAIGPAPVIALSGCWRRPAQREAWSAPTSDDETALVAQCLWQAHAGAAWGDMAVIARSGGPALVRLARGLAAAGVPVRVEGETLALADVPAVAVLLDALRLVVDVAQGAASDGQWLGFWCSPVVGLDEMDMTRLDGLDEVLAVRDGATARMHELAASLPACSPAEVLWGVWTLGDWPQRLRAAALAQASGAERANRDLDAVIALFDLADGLTQRGADGVDALTTLVRQQVVQRDRARESSAGDAVTLLGAFQAKGRGWPVVAVTGVNEGEWPMRSVPSSLLEPERLAADGQLPPMTRGEQMRAERRLFTLATSRACRHLIVTGAGEEPSRFLSEISLTAQPWAGGGEPQSAGQLVGQLRAVASAPETAPGLVDEAARVLARLRGVADGADPAGWWWVGGSTPGSRPLSPPGRPLRLAASTVRRVLDCPRAWFLADRAGAAPVPGPQASFGLLAHALFATCAAGPVPADTVESMIAAAWPGMGFRSKWQADGRLEALRQGLERYLAWRDSRRRRLLGTEIDFRHVWLTDAGPVEVTGRVDRLEMDEAGRLVVIDFKTSLSPRIEQHVDQMGLYCLGAASGAFEALAPGVRAVAEPELVWPLAVPRQTDRGCRVDPVPLTDVLPALGSAARVVMSERFDAIAGPACRSCVFWAGCPALAVGVADA